MTFYSDHSLDNLFDIYFYLFNNILTIKFYLTKLKYELIYSTKKSNTNFKIKIKLKILQYYFKYLFNIF